MAASRARFIVIIGMIGLTACGAIAEPPPVSDAPRATATDAGSLDSADPIATIAVDFVTPSAPTQPPQETMPATVAATEMADSAALNYFWPNQATLQLTAAEWNPTGWDYTLSTPEFNYGEPEYIGIMLSGGSLAPQLPELGQLGALVEPRTIRGLPGFYESGGFGFRLAWEEDGQRYSMNVLGMNEEEALLIADQFQLLSAEELESRFDEAK